MPSPSLADSIPRKPGCSADEGQAILVARADRERDRAIGADRNTRQGDGGGGAIGGIHKEELVRGHIGIALAMQS